MRRADLFADDALGFLADAEINSADVFAENTEEQQLRARENENRRHQRAPAGWLLIKQMFNHYFDDGEKPERARDHSCKSHQAKWQNGNVHQHADPKPDEPAKIVAAAALGPLDVAHLRRTDVLGDLENQAVDIRIRRARFGDLIDDEATHAAETAQVKFARLVDDEIGDAIREPAAGVAPPRVFLAFVNAENDVALFRFGHEIGRAHV